MALRRFALFDLDYTLIPQDTLLLFCNYTLRRHRYRVFFLLIFLPIVPLAALRLIGSKTLKSFFLSFLFGLSKDSIEESAKDFVKRSVLPRIYPELKAEVDRHKKEGRITVLNTAAPLFYAKYIGKELGFDYTYGTPVKLPERFPLIAKIDGANNKKYAKIERMMDLLPSAVQITLKADPPKDRSKPDYPTDVILKDSWSYSDSDADLPMLRLTEFGRLVHPEKRSFIEEAKVKDWLILKPSRPYKTVVGKVGHLAQMIAGFYPD